MHMMNSDSIMKWYKTLCLSTNPFDDDQRQYSNKKERTNDSIKSAFENNKLLGHYGGNG